MAIPEGGSYNFLFNSTFNILTTINLCLRLHKLK
jgi:hypothetical protein